MEIQKTINLFYGGMDDNVQIRWMPEDKEYWMRATLAVKDEEHPEKNRNPVVARFDSDQMKQFFENVDEMKKAFEAIEAQRDES